MENIPSDKRIAEEIQAAIDKDNSFKQCICCRHYNKASGTVQSGVGVPAKFLTGIYIGDVHFNRGNCHRFQGIEDGD